LEKSKLSFTKIATEQQKNGSIDQNSREEDDLSLDKLPDESASDEIGVDEFSADGVVASPSLEPDNHIENRQKLYEDLSHYLEKVLEAARGEKSFPLDPGFRIIREIVEVNPPQDFLFIKAIHHDDQFRFVTNHSVNVAIFAVKIAENLGFSKKKQVEIGMAGLLHDVGTALIPENIINKAGKLNDEEYTLLKERPNLSYKILRSVGGNHNYLAECALQVYEKIDGSGYPKGLRGEEIHEYAQIIGLIDIYEALIHSRPQRERYLHFSAVKEIIRTGKESFQRKHLKALLNIFSIFPIYSYVRLNSNATGRVIQTYTDHPMRPKLEIIFDSQKRKVLTERIINLPDNPLLHITNSVSEEEIEHLDKSPDGGGAAGDDIPFPEEEEKIGDKENRKIKGGTPQRAKKRRSGRFSSLKIALAITAAALLAAGILWQFWFSDSWVLKQNEAEPQSGVEDPFRITRKIPAPPGA